MNQPTLGLNSQYLQRFSKFEAYRKQVWTILCRNFFSAHIPKDSCVLDLGCGWGEFINHIECGQKYSMDLNPDSPSKIQPGIIHHVMDARLNWPFEPARFDIIFSSNFLEHLPDKTSVEQVLAHAHRHLKPGGLFILMGPNIRVLNGLYWSYWDHHVPLCDRSVQELLRLVGFEIKSCTARFLPYDIQKTSPFPQLLVALYLKMKWAWPIFGKQFLVFAVKKA